MSARNCTRLRNKTMARTRRVLSHLLNSKYSTLLIYGMLITQAEGAES